MYLYFNIYTLKIDLENLLLKIKIFCNPRRFGDIIYKDVHP